MTIPPPNFDASIGSINWTDTPDGALKTTAFGEIASADSENKVFIIKRDAGNWKKVRVLRSGEGYELQHADIGATDFETLEIAKNALYERVTVDLDAGVVTAEPEDAKWDLLYGTYTEALNFGGGKIPYGFSDYIVSNRGDVSIAMVETANTTYEAFAASDAISLEFKTEINTIGSSWRKGGGWKWPDHCMMTDSM